MPVDLTAIDADWPTLHELSVRYMHLVLAYTRGNKTKAAEMLGIDRRTVSRVLAHVAQGRTPTMHTAASVANAPTTAPSRSTAASAANAPTTAEVAGKQTAARARTATTKTTGKNTAAKRMR